jgi:PAS domain S-box-containing protein
MALGECILVVEDEGVVAKDLQARLKKLGYQVPFTVPTGEEAIERARELRPALILMDVRLKGQIDGVEAAARIQQNARTPVIFLTAYADEGTLNRAKVTEPFGYILKPFNERELHTAIQVALFKHNAEIELRKSERWLAATLQGMGEAVIAVDAGGRIVFMNLLAQSLTGWQASQAVGLPLEDVFRIRDSKTGSGIVESLALSFKEGRPLNLNGDTVLTTRGGPEVCIEDSAATIRDDDGNVSGGVLVFRDITDRKRAEEALRLSEEKFRLLVDGIKEYAIYMLDREGKVSSWNPGSERITGYKAEEVLGRHLSIFYTDNDIASKRPKTRWLQRPSMAAIRRRLGASARMARSVWPMW